jgi:regulatory protein
VRITKIETQKKTPGRVSIFADGEFLIGLNKETLIRAALRVGDEITPALVSELTTRETLLSAKNAALRLLAIRPRSEKEIIDRLREKEYGAEDIACVVNDLRTAHLLDDVEFARAFIRNALTLRPIGEIQIRRKLLLLGVAKPLIDEAVRETLSATDMTEVAREAATAYLRKMKHSRAAQDPRKKRNNLAAFLARRGYGWTTISAVLKNLDLPEGDDRHDE